MADVMSWSDHNTDSVGSLLWTTDVPRDACNLLYASVSYDTSETGQKPVDMWFMACTVHFIGPSDHFSRQFSFLPRLITCSQQNPNTKKWEEKKITTVIFKTRGHLSRLAWPTQRDGLSRLASPRHALRCAAWPGKTSPDPCPRPVATSGCSHRYCSIKALCITVTPSASIYPSFR